MDEPDFQELSEASVWSVGCWSDAWLYLRNNEPHEGRREAVWEAARKVSLYMAPDLAVIALLTVLHG